MKHKIYITPCLKIIMEKKSDNSSGIISVILGILSIVLGIGVIFGSFAGLILGVISLFFAINQKKNNSNKWSKAGMVLSIIGIVINLLIFVLLITVLTKIAMQIQELQSSGALNQVNQISQYASP